MKNWIRVNLVSLGLTSIVSPLTISCGGRGSPSYIENVQYNLSDAAGKFLISLKFDVFKNNLNKTIGTFAILFQNIQKINEL